MSICRRGGVGDLPPLDNGRFSRLRSIVKDSTLLGTPLHPSFLVLLEECAAIRVDTTTTHNNQPPRSKEEQIDAKPIQVPNADP